MSTSTIVIILVVWTIVSFVLGVVFGKAIKYARGDEE